MSDPMLMGVIAGFVALVVWALSTGVYVQRVWDLKKAHAAEIGKMNAERILMQKALRTQETRARVMGAMPVSRLLGDNDE